MMTRTSSHQETQDVAKAFARSVKGGDLVALIGDLGAGKTTFVQGLAAALGVSATVKSPTFAVMHEYLCNHPTIRRFVHADLYRFTAVDDMRALALPDEQRGDTVIVIEWPNVLPSVLFHPTHTVQITHEGGNARNITISS